MYNERKGEIRKRSKSRIKTIEEGITKEKTRERR